MTTSIADSEAHDGAASRPLIVATVVVMAAFVVVDALISTRSFWANDVLHALVGLFLLAALVGYALSLLPRGPWPAQFEVREGSAFVVPASRQYGYFVAAQVMLSGALLDRAIDGWTEPVAAEATISRVVTSATLVLAVLVVGIVARTLVTALLPRPAIELTPDALVVRDGFGTRTIPWTALRPNVSSVLGALQTMTLPVEQHERIVRRGLTLRSPQVALAWARVHPRFFADAVRYYVENPDRRALIGTSAEHERLLADLGSSVRGGSAR